MDTTMTKKYNIGDKVIYKERLSTPGQYKATSGKVLGFSRICDEECLIVCNYDMRIVVPIKDIILVKQKTVQQ